MIDFNDPTRSELSVIMFPDANAVTAFINTLDDSVNQLSVLSPDDPHYDDIVKRNKDYIAAALTYPEVQQAGVDLSVYQAVVS